VKLPLTIKLLQFTHTQNLLLSILATLRISPHFGETFLQKDYIRCQSKMQAFPIIFSAFLFSQISLGSSQIKKLSYQLFQKKSFLQTFPFNQISQILYFFNID